ncbi:MAG: hypothetical protein HOD72_05955 [Opitutae bacterium]|nr:hypothetical protein [Opitutae bacterium]
MGVCSLTVFIENCSPFGEIPGFGIFSIESDLWRAVLVNKVTKTAVAPSYRALVLEFERPQADVVRYESSIDYSVTVTPGV